jgi:hypothetical protein
MDAQIYEIRNEVIVPQICHKGISYLAFSDTIAHIAKSSEHHIDIYSEFLTKYADHWYVETWKRGHAILESPSIKDVTSVSILGTTYKESQDHAKWAVAAQYFWMGDLNRMITQAKRGGGGLLDMHKGTIEAFRAIIHA